MYRSVLNLAPILGFFLAACVAEGEETDSSEGELNGLTSYFADAKRLDLGDLERTTVGFASNELNNQLSVTSSGIHGGMHFDTPTVFAAHDATNRILPDQFEVKALDKIVGGLSAQYGETELGTQVNATRLKHLEAGQDHYYVESGFKVDGNVGLNHGWSFNPGGFGVGVSLGFNAGAELSSRVIVATDDSKVKAILSAPLAAVKEMRGFVYPRAMDDVRNMKPGEMYALRGLGRLGANFGIGAPIFVAEPTGGLAYRIVVSAGVAGVVEGQVDVQLVRLDGDEIVVDLGVEKGHGVSFSAGINDEWGIKGLCEDGQKCLRGVDLAGKHIDLARLVEKAVEKQVNNYLTFSISGGVSQSSSRISLSRFRFHLDRGNKEETSKALEQLLKFDMRLAQAIYNRDLDQANAPITQDFDAVRAATTATRNFGFELLGMNIYQRAVVERQGSFVLQTPAGARSFLFDHVTKNSGWFQQRHTYSRTGIAAQSVDENSPTRFRSDANLFIETVSADKHISDDAPLDNIDNVLLGIGAHDVVDILDNYGNQLERKVWQTCPQQTTPSGDEGQSESAISKIDACNVALLDTAPMKQLKADALAAVEAKIGSMPDDYKALVRAAANMRLTLQSTSISNVDPGNGPQMAVTASIRFDDKALETLASRSRDDYAAALRAYLGSTNADRRDVKSPADVIAAGKDAENRSRDAVTKMAALFENQARAYRQIVEAEKALPTLLSGKRFVSYPLGIRFSIGNDERATLESGTLRSTSHDRAVAAERLYDGLLEQAKHLHGDLHEEHAALFPLVALVPKSQLEVGMTYDVTLDSGSNSHRQRFVAAGLQSTSSTARGADVQTLGAGMFDLRTIVNASP